MSDKGKEKDVKEDTQESEESEENEENQEKGGEDIQPGGEQKKEVRENTNEPPKPPLQLYKINKIKQNVDFPKHCPYVMIMAKFEQAENLVDDTQNYYFKCYIESENPKSYNNVKYLFKCEKFSKEVDDIWIANLYLGEIARIQVWRHSIFGEDTFLGEMLDNRSITRLKYLSYDYFTDQKIIQSKKSKKEVPANDIRSFFIPSKKRDDNQRNQRNQNFEERNLYAIGNKNKMLKTTIEKMKSPSFIKISLFAFIPRTESIMKMAKFYNNYLEGRVTNHDYYMDEILKKMNIRKPEPDKEKIECMNKIKVQSNRVNIFFHLYGLDKRNEEELLLVFIRKYAEYLYDNRENFTKSKETNNKEYNGKERWSRCFFSGRPENQKKKHEEKKNGKPVMNPEKMISVNRWGKFLILVQKEGDISREKMDSLLKRYPIVRLRHANERALKPYVSNIDAKIQRWLKNENEIKMDLFPEEENLEPPAKSRTFCTRRRFFEYLFDPEENSIMNPVKADIHKTDTYMSHPLCDYWIDSSHNTYLSGDQLQSFSSIEMYRRALLRGCRCVELDVHDGTDDIPIVYHGYTLTTKVTFYDCIEAICESAFIVSDYPVILSLEVHCGDNGKKAMAKILKQLLRRPQFLIFPEKNKPSFKEVQEPLWIKPAWSTNPKPDEADLTPERLKNKILIKTAGAKSKDKNKEDEKKEKEEQQLVQKNLQKELIGNGRFLEYFKYIRLDTKEIMDSDFKLSHYAHIPTKKVPIWEEDDNKDAKGAKGGKGGKGAKGTKGDKGVKDQGSKEVKEEEKVEVDNVTTDDGREWHVMSVEETVGLEHIKNEKDKENWIRYNKKSLSRIYPRGNRFNSSNYCPLPFWDTGCQIVALNYQTSSYPMWLNEGKFMRAGRTGYILKPERLRSTKIQKDDQTEYFLSVKVISGWRLPRPWGDSESYYSTENISEPFVVMSFWTTEKVLNGESKPKEKDIISYCKTEKSKNPHNPIWNDKVHTFQGKDKELDMLVFEVIDGSTESYNPFAKKHINKTMGYFAITVDDIRVGFRTVPLKGVEGAPLVAGELFVWIAITNDEVKETIRIMNVTVDGSELKSTNDCGAHCLSSKFSDNKM